MKQISRLAEGLLRATGIYSDAALAKIDDGLAANPGMPLLDGILRFGGEKEPLFLQKIAEALGLEYVEIEKAQPRPEVISSELYIFLPTSTYCFVNLPLSPRL